MFISKDSQNLIKRLQTCGHKAYAVGGVVRDFLMGKKCSDTDITTSATPNEVTECFKDYKLVLTGLKHGTVTVVLNGKNYEITTFRKEFGYTDNRHPDGVNFVTNLSEDLSRRDFTINAMAYNEEEGIIDLYGGQNDIKNKIIKTVGNADQRFKEDALRILRALRFSSRLNFKIEKNTKIAILKNANLLKNISVERLYSELTGILLGDAVESVLLEFKEVFFTLIPQLKDCDGFLQKSKYHKYDVYKHIVKSVSLSKKDKIVRWALYLHDIEKPSCFSRDGDGVGHFYGHQTKSAKTAVEILKHFKAESYVISTVNSLIYLHDSKTELTRSEIKMQMSKYSYEFLKLLTHVRVGDALAHAFPYSQVRAKNARAYLNTVKDVIKNKECYTLKQLCVNGQDVKNLGYNGAQIKEKLNFLLKAVIYDEVKNEKSELLRYIDEK